MKARPQGAGKTVRHPSGYAAFIPHPLPPEIAWRPRLLRALSDADRLIGQLAREGGSLPNPHPLMRPFVRREAVLSSRIEGTEATQGELLAAEAGAAVQRSPADLREVGNYVAALEHGTKRLSRLPLSLRLVRELHAKLMHGVRGNVATPGEFRRTQNWIGPPGCTLANATYVPPPPEQLTKCLAAWEDFLHDRSLPPLVHTALMHYQFEAIHPFLDGNGRVGRLLVTLFLVERAVLPTPLLYLSAFFEATRSDYYARLRGVSAEGDWASWLHYFFNGVARQSEDALDRASRIQDKLSEWERAVRAAGSEAPARVLDLLAGNPFVTARGISERLTVARSTAARAITALVGLGILTQVDARQRDRAYCANDLLAILEEPARLLPTE